MSIPKALRLITDLVLKYRPKAKSEGAKKRAKKRRKIKRGRGRE